MLAYFYPTEADSFLLIFSSHPKTQTPHPSSNRELKGMALGFIVHL